MASRISKYLVLSLAVVFSFVFFLSNVSAESCWSYTASETCNGASGCIWKNDTWNPTGWCETLSCWSLTTQDTCLTTTVPGGNCTWNGGGTSYSCEELSCWSFSGTNNNTCINNAGNKSCTWSNSCYSIGGTGSVDCWSILTQATCQNTTGCAWGQCQEAGCWSYNLEDTCNAGKDWRGVNCTWSSSGSGYCTERNCWNYNNQTACNSVNGGAANGGLACEWKWGSCQEKNCYSFDYTNETACVNNTIGETCTWSNGYCNTDSCWSATSNASCSSKSGCQWRQWQSSGWCSEVNCWTWDSMNGYNQTQCESLDADYGITCTWSGNPPGNATSGWCYQDYSSTSCANITTETECYGSNYCWWQANDWSNPGAGGNCTEPTWGTGGYSDGSVFNEWNPGCYIFDVNSTNCNNILGCNYSNGLCNEVASGDFLNYSVNISADGIKCSYINSSGLCNNIASLSSCCSWQNGTCSENRQSTSCWNQISQTPNGEQACEDADTSADCNTIAGDPWYMPCQWSNSSSKCEFKASQVFGNSTQSLVKIENQRNCEAAGGKWLSENYCEGSVSVPAGRCEYKFDEETNCDKACFACENRDSSGNLINATNAKSACEQSKLGFCEFTSSTSAPNGVGFCNAKEQFKKGLAGDCNANCGDCTFLGNPNSNSTRDSSNNCLKASCFCLESDANAGGGGCKWINDNSTLTGGYCLNKGAKTCEDACDRCYARSDCVSTGRSAFNSTGSCKWEGSDDDGTCVSNIGNDVEICWDGIDNNDNSLVDCGDPSCYSDSWCGFVEGNCFGWTTQATCQSNDCEWVNDTWNPTGWCDFKGAQCWKYDNSANECLGTTQVSNTTINITTARVAGNNINESATFSLSPIGTGIISGSIVMTNMSGAIIGAGNYSIISLTAGTINFTNTTFMVTGGGAGNFTNVSYQFYANRSANCEWSNGTGTGWCERDWSVAEQCFNKNRTACTTPCTWTNDTWCNGQGNGTDWCNNNGGWCDHSDFASQDCWQQVGSASCNSATGCAWHTDPWAQAHCEVNWSGNCWNNFNSSTCGAATGCAWRTDGGGGSGWCDNAFGQCWSQSTQAGCAAVSGVSCAWRNYGGGGGTCEPSCFNATTSNSCSTIPGCVWMAESGWCEEQQSQACYNTTNSNNQTSCDATPGCKWNNPGWCDPKGGGFSAGSNAGGGGGGGGAFGADCYKYDGNQTLCTNQSIINISCAWFTESNPFCEVDWSQNCWQYSSVEGGCNATNNCWWNPNGNFCSNVMDQCWGNMSLQNDASACNANAYCNSTSYGCEPTCFSATTQGACGSGCKWLSGFCEPAGMLELFDGISSGAPVPLGGDTCPDSGVQASVDLCGFGMKDMGDAFGFGANVIDFGNSSVCNKEQISSHVMVQGAPSGQDRIGSGNETLIYLVYLDTDGSTGGGCKLEHDSSAEGYEFKFRYASEWNATKDKAIETFNAYKCENLQWAATDIKLSSWKKIMCGEIGGPMIAVKKSELTRFPTLYTSTADMRVYVSTANTANLSNPSDTAGPGWTTPGSIDFDIFDAFSYGADSAKFEDILKKGFVQGEDCFTPGDDDNDGKVNCFDYDCQFASQCSGLGVNAGNYTDTTSPLVTGVKIEEYTDGALISYDSSKPTNGTLEFYRNDSQCLTLNKSVFDIGITSTNVRDYKLWHAANVYEGTLGYALTNNTQYYYKLKVCDNANKCAVSKCSSFITAQTGKCSFCDFVTRIKVPSGWNVSYDGNQDGTYEHAQGQVCGATAGMKTNYTMGRAVNIKLSKSDGSVYFEFINASLSKTNLNDKVRTVSESGAFIGSSTLAGLTSDTRDKIINNLHPELCRVKVPSPGACTQLFHCDDDGNNCVDRTASATLIDATNCVWQIPNCEFSTYKTNTASSSSSSSSSSGGGGGGAGFNTCGDGTKAGSEECDDGNIINGDGCSSTCKIEVQLFPSADSGSEESGGGAQQGENVAEDETTGGEIETAAKGVGKVFAWTIGTVLIIGAVIFAVYFINKKRRLRGY